MNRTSTALMLLLSFATSACQDAGPKQNVGTVVGGVGGAVVGSQIGHGTGRLVGVAAGTLLGALIGSEVGKSLDRADLEYANRANQRALEYDRVGQTSTWRNPDSGNSGTITPRRTYQAASGEPCREFQQTITVGGEQQSAYGTACRQADGSWKIVQ